VCELRTFSQDFHVVNNSAVTLSPYRTLFETVRDAVSYFFAVLIVPWPKPSLQSREAPLQNPYRTEPCEKWVASLRGFTDVIGKSRVHKLPVPVGHLSYAVCTWWVKELIIIVPLSA